MNLCESTDTRLFHPIYVLLSNMCDTLQFNILSVIIQNDVTPRDVFGSILKKIPSAGRGVLRALSRDFRRAVAECYMLVRVDRVYKFVDWFLPSGVAGNSDIDRRLADPGLANLLDYFGLAIPFEEIYGSRIVAEQVTIKRGCPSDFFPKNVPWSAELLAKHCSRLPDMKRGDTIKVSVHTAMRRGNTALLEHMSSRAPSVRTAPGYFAAGYPAAAQFDRSVFGRRIPRDIIALGSLEQIVDAVKIYGSGLGYNRDCVIHRLLTVGRWAAIDAVHAAISDYFEYVEVYRAVEKKYSARMSSHEYITEFLARDFLPRHEFLRVVCEIRGASGLEELVQYGIGPDHVAEINVPEDVFERCFAGHPHFNTPVDVFSDLWPVHHLSNRLSLGQVITVGPVVWVDPMEVVAALEHSLENHPKTKVTEELLEQARTVARDETYHQLRYSGLERGMSQQG